MPLGDLSRLIPQPGLFLGKLFLQYALLSFLVLNWIIQNSEWRLRTNVSASNTAQPNRYALLLRPTVLHRSSDECANILQIPKVAFLFLTRGKLYHGSAWKLWLRSAAKIVPVKAIQKSICLNSAQNIKLRRKVKQHCLIKQNPTEEKENHPGDADYKKQFLFSFYVHIPPSFGEFDPKSFWYNMVIHHRIETFWGSHTLVEATRNLLWEAFKDPLNTRFVLLSESDIPIYDPLTFYQQIQSETRSRIDTSRHSETSIWRWHPHMESSKFRLEHWRKSSQWISLTREHAQLVLEDREIFRTFERYCWSAWDEGNMTWQNDCFSDEHYFATLLAVHKEKGVNGSQGISFTVWKPYSAHPENFQTENITSDLIHVARNPPTLFESGSGRECNATEAQNRAQSLFVPINKLIVNPEQCLSLKKQEINFDTPLPDLCFLTARKFGIQAKKAVQKLFKDCKVRLISNPLCEDLKAT